MHFEKVRGIIAEQLGLDESTITMESNLLDDLKADSLDMMELVMSLEDEYNLSVPDDVLLSIRTVRDIVEYLDKNNA